MHIEFLIKGLHINLMLIVAFLIWNIMIAIVVRIIYLLGYYRGHEIGVRDTMRDIYGGDGNEEDETTKTPEC